MSRIVGALTVHVVFRISTAAICTAAICTGAFGTGSAAHAECVATPADLAAAGPVAPKRHAVQHARHPGPRGPVRRVVAQPGAARPPIVAAANSTACTHPAALIAAPLLTPLPGGAYPGAAPGDPGAALTPASPWTQGSPFIGSRAGNGLSPAAPGFGPQSAGSAPVAPIAPGPAARFASNPSPPDRPILFGPGRAPFGLPAAEIPAAFPPELPPDLPTEFPPDLPGDLPRAPGQLAAPVPVPVPAPAAVWVIALPILARLRRSRPDR